MNNSRKPFNQLVGRLNVVGNNIEHVRKSKNLSRQNLSDKLMIMGIDISGQSIYNIEVGMRIVADYELCAIAQILDMTADELLKDFRKSIIEENK